MVLFGSAPVPFPPLYGMYKNKVGDDKNPTEAMCYGHQEPLEGGILKHFQTGEKITSVT